MVGVGQLGKGGLGGMLASVSGLPAAGSAASLAGLASGGCCGLSSRHSCRLCSGGGLLVGSQDGDAEVLRHLHSVQAAPFSDPARLLYCRDQSRWC